MKWTLSPALLLAACSGGAEDAADGAEQPVASVAVGRAEVGTVEQAVKLYGAAEAGPEGTATLVAPAEAIVARIAAPVGTPVTRGQRVAMLMPGPTTRADLAKASADTLAANAAYARQRRLRADGLAGDAEVETARAAAQGTGAVYKSLSNRTSGLSLRASADGVVQSVAVNPGDLLQQGAPVATIARLGKLRARFGVDPAAARALRPGAPVTIEAGRGRASLAVPITSISPVVDPQTKLAAVFVDLPADAGFAIGEPLSASAAIGGGRRGVTIPYTALLDDGGQPYVFVVAGGIAHRRDVVAATASGDRVAVASGVAAGQRVVTEGGTAIEDGMKVRTR